MNDQLSIETDVIKIDPNEIQHRMENMEKSQCHKHYHVDQVQNYRTT